MFFFAPNLITWLVMLQALKEEPALDAKCKDKFLILSTLVEGPLASMNITDLVRIFFFSPLWLLLIFFFFK